MEARGVLGRHDLGCVEGDARLGTRGLTHIEQRLGHVLRQLALSVL